MPIDVFDQSGEDFAGAYFYDRPYAQGNHFFHCFLPAHRRYHLPLQEFPGIVRGMKTGRIIIGNDRYQGGPKSNFCEITAEKLGGSAKQT